MLQRGDRLVVSEISRLGGPRVGDQAGDGDTGNDPAPVRGGPAALGSEDDRREGCALAHT